MNVLKSHSNHAHWKGCGNQTMVTTTLQNYTTHAWSFDAWCFGSPHYHHKTTRNVHIISRTHHFVQSRITLQEGSSHRKQQCPTATTRRPVLEKHTHSLRLTPIRLNCGGVINDFFCAAKLILVLVVLFQSLYSSALPCTYNNEIFEKIAEKCQRKSQKANLSYLPPSI